jgi:hypothetical protein
MVALIYNWWSIFTRMATGSRHGEAITTRPLFQHGVTRRTRHANQTVLSLARQDGKARTINDLLSRMGGWVQRIHDDAEQLAKPARWARLLWRRSAELVGSPIASPGILALTPFQTAGFWLKHLHQPPPKFRDSDNRHYSINLAGYKAP